MDSKNQTDRNLVLFEIFMQQALESEELCELIPNGANIIFLPENDAELREANLKLADDFRREGKEPVFVKISFVPKTMTVMIPQIELLKSA